MRTRKEVKEDLVDVINYLIKPRDNPESPIFLRDNIAKAIDLWLEMQDVPADDKVNANCYTCGNVIRVTKETREELRRNAGVFICEECHERGKLATTKP